MRLLIFKLGPERPEQLLVTPILDYGIMMLYSRANMKNTKLGSVEIYYSAYNKAAVLKKKLTMYPYTVLSLMQLIIVTILLVIHGNPTATVFK